MGVGIPDISGLRILTYSPVSGQIDREAIGKRWIESITEI